MPRPRAIGRTATLVSQAVTGSDELLEQVLDMLTAVCALHGHLDHSRPILQTALDGLRAGR